MPFKRPIHGDERVSDTVWSFTAITRDQHWIWTGPVDISGIPTTSGEENHSVRKLMYEAFAHLPRNTSTYARCGVSLCVNPIHTGLDTQKKIVRFWS